MTISELNGIPGGAFTVPERELVTTGDRTKQISIDKITLSNINIGFNTTSTTNWNEKNPMLSEWRPKAMAVWAMGGGGDMIMLHEHG